VAWEGVSCEGPGKFEYSQMDGEVGGNQPDLWFWPEWGGGGGAPKQKKSTFTQTRDRLRAAEGHGIKAVACVTIKSLERSGLEAGCNDSLGGVSFVQGI